VSEQLARRPSPQNTFTPQIIAAGIRDRAKLLCFVSLCIAPLFTFRFAAGAPAPLVYLTNLDAALAFAKENGRTVILYTGRSSVCDGKEPRDYFFDFIVRNYPELGARSNVYLVCEQFIFSATNDDIAVFLHKEKPRHALYARYHIKTFYPTVTFLDTTKVSLPSSAVSKISSHSLAPF